LITAGPTLGDHICWYPNLGHQITSLAEVDVWGLFFLTILAVVACINTVDALNDYVYIVHAPFKSPIVQGRERAFGIQGNICQEKWACHQFHGTWHVVWEIWEWASLPRKERCLSFMLFYVTFEASESMFEVSGPKSGWYDHQSSPSLSTKSTKLCWLVQKNVAPAVVWEITSMHLRMFGKQNRCT